MPASQVIEELLNKNLIMRTLNWGSWKDMNNQEISMELQNSFWSLKIKHNCQREKISLMFLLQSTMTDIDPSSL